MPEFKYQRVAGWIRAQVESGFFEEEKRIPGEEELCDRFDVSRQTVRQAMKILEEEGLVYKIQGSGTYVCPRNGALRKEEKSSIKSVGVLMNSVNDYIFPQVLKGINDCLYENGYAMRLCILSQQYDLEREAIRRMIGDRVSGLIAEPVKSGLPLINRELYCEFAREHPLVFLHRRADGILESAGFRAGSIMLDDAGGFWTLAEHLYEKGHRKIAAVCKLDESTGVARYEGYMKFMLEHQLEIENEWIFWYSSEDIQSMFTGHKMEWMLERISGCTAVMCHDDRIAFRLIQLLRDKGIRVPEDMAVTGFDNSEYASMDITLTTIVHPQEELGRRAAQAVLNLLKEPGQHVSFTFPAALRTGRSTDAQAGLDCREE